MEAHSIFDGVRRSQGTLLTVAAAFIVDGVYLVLAHINRNSFQGYLGAFVVLLIGGVAVGWLRRQGWLAAMAGVILAGVVISVLTPPMAPYFRVDVQTEVIWAIVTGIFIFTPGFLLGSAVPTGVTTAASRTSDTSPRVESQAIGWASTGKVRLAIAILAVGIMAFTIFLIGVANNPIT